MIPRRISHRFFTNSPGKSRKKVDCAVYGTGLSGSGALAIPKLVESTVNENGEAPPREVDRAKRISHFNISGIRQISSGFGFSLFASERKLFGAGLNNKFQISGRQDYYISAKKISLPENPEILEISSGRAHSLILTSSGVFAIGDNNFGQCGRNPEDVEHIVTSSESPLTPVDVPGDVISVHCSLDTSFLVNSEGHVFSFGLNEDGQCANGKYGIQWKPRRILGDLEGVKILKVSGSTDTLMAIGEEDAFIWGQTEYGQAGGVCDDIQLSTARCLNLSSTSIGGIRSAAATSTSVIVQNKRGEVFVWGVGVLGMGPDLDILKRPTLMDQPLFDGKQVSQIFAGNSCMAAINSSGRLFVWGENRFSQLGLGHSNRQLFPYQVFLPGDVRNVSLGPDHSLFLVN